MKNTIKVIFFTTTLFLAHTITPFPHKLEQIVLTENKKFKKIITLISDQHAPMHQDVKKIKHKTAKHMTKKETTSPFSTAERRFLVELRSLNEKAKKNSTYIDLFWESSPDRPRIKNFMSMAGQSLAQEFNKSKSENIQFYHSDTFRRKNSQYMGRIYTYGEPRREQASTLFELTKVYTIQQYLNAMRKKIDNTFNLLISKKRINTDQAAQLKTIINGTKQGIQKIEQTFLPKDKQQNIGKWLKNLKKNNKQKFNEFKLLWVKRVTLAIADFEMLANILNSKKENIILYAGSYHCRNISKLLIEKFGGQRLVEIGLDLDAIHSKDLVQAALNIVPKGSQKVHISLYHSAWNFLRDPIRLGKKYYTVARRRIRTLSAKDMAIFHRIYNTKEEQSIIKDIKKLIQIGFGSYLDIVHTQKRDQYNTTLIHIAAQKNWPNVLKLLFRHGAISNTRNAKNVTPLHVAAHHGHNEIVDILLSHGANPNIVDAAEKTPLLLAIQKSNLAIVKKFVARGALVNLKNKNRDTPLHLAAQNNNCEIVKLLLENLADPQAMNNQFEIAVDKATDPNVKALFERYKHEPDYFEQKESD